MDKWSYASVVARERKNEIEKELATRHMLKEAGFYTPKAEKSKRMVLRSSAVVIVISLLVFYFVR